MENNKREKFASRLGFILVSAGCAVGLGNVWKFPYICGINGGAIFIILYLICLCLLGLPILISEFAVGRGSGQSIGKAFRTLEPEGTRWHKFRYFGFAGNYLLMAFYTMVAGWMLNYVYLTATGKLSGLDTDGIDNTFNNMLGNNAVLILWTLVVVVLCIGICSFGIQNGVEKVTKVMMMALIVLMIVMAARSLTLKGSGEGLKFYLIPNPEAVKERGFGNVLFDAMSHAFFTLSVGMGSMEIFGSYLAKDRKLTGEGISVMTLDTLIALMAGIIIIPACFAYGVSPDRGPSLLFVTLPNVFNHMPAGRLWGSMFFIFMSFAALSTVIAVYENIISMSIDLFGWNRKKALLINMVGIAVCSLPAVFGYNIWSGVQLLGAGTNIMDVEDFLVSYNILPLGALVFVMFCTKNNGWGFDNFVKEADTGKGINFPVVIRFHMKYIIPLIVLVIYFKGYYDTFKSRELPVFITWMIISVLFVAFILYISSKSSKRNKPLSKDCQSEK